MKIFFIEIGLSIIALLLFIFDLLFKKQNKSLITGWFTSFGLLTLTIILLFYHPYGTLWGFSSDSFSIFLKGIFLIAGFIGAIGSIPYCVEKIPSRAGEYYLLILLSLLGMCFLSSSKNILLFFISFELMSLPLYALSGFYKEDERAPETALKFLLVGTFSSGILFFGLSLLYGASSAFEFSLMREKLLEITPLGTLGMVLFLVGLGFKIAVIPFHTWVPDTYEGAQSSYVSFLSVAPKSAGFAGLFRFLFEVFPKEQTPLFSIIALLSALTMTVGNLLALPQTNIKRLLAYSSIAHIGYILIGVASANELGVSMVLFYLFTYIFSNMGAFLVVETVVLQEQDERIDALKGLSQKNPVLSLSMLLFLLSLGGIPFVAGFWAKLFVFLAGVKSGLWVLALIGAVLTIVALFYYLMVARRMYIEKEEKEAPFKMAFPLKLSVGICVLGVLFFGIFPRVLIKLTDWAQAGIFIKP